MGKNKSRKRNSRFTMLAFFLVILICVCLFLTVYFVFKVDDVEYSGNVQCSNEELNQSIFKGKSANTLIYFLFHNNSTVSIPFVQKYDVEIQWPNKMKIVVYEKPIIGYINYMGCNMFFDKDGVIVESSTKTLSGIPQVTGLSFKSIVLNSKLEVPNPSIFTRIVELKQSFDKYEISVSKIYFDIENQVTIYLGDNETKDVKVLLGDSTDFVDKLFELKQIIPKLKGLKGTLHLENFTEDSSSVFKQEN